MRRTPLRRTAGPQRRKPLRAQSKKRADEAGTRRAIVRDAVSAVGVCPLYPMGGCRGRLVGHELVKRSQLRGAHLNRDLVIAVCEQHNSWIEDNPRAAQAAGVAVPRWVYDRHGPDALKEAARLRGRMLTGRPDVPFWIT